MRATIARVNHVPRDYYRVTSAGETFDARLRAIRDVVVPGSRVVDVGCNDGRLSLALLASGHASEVTGIDLENIVAERDPRFHFVKADLRESGASVVPDSDVILCLNVLHHLLLAGPDFVRSFLAELLGRAESVLVDLGSLTETGPWPWRQLMARLWTSDEDVASDLFEPALWRRPLCVYRAQNGRRVLWKLSARRPAAYAFEVRQRYRRTIGTHWPAKRLVAVADDDEIPSGCTPEVIFCELKRRETNERFWAKRYLGVRAVGWRRETEESVVAFLREREPAAMLPIDARDDFGAIYPYEESLFRGRAIHYFDRHLLAAPHRRRYERLESLIFSEGPFAGLPLGVIADPQAIVTPAGVTFVDFEPSHHYTELVAYLQRATPTERHEILCAFWDVNPTFDGSFPPAVRKEIHEALGTDLFRGIARERLRVARNREIRAAFASLTSGHVVESMRNALAALRSEARRIRRNGPTLRLTMRSTAASLRRARG